MTVTQNPNPVARWSIGGLFLEALAARDYRLMATTLAPEVRFRAMLPPGPMDWEGPATVADVFSSWFGVSRDLRVGRRDGRRNRRSVAHVMAAARAARSVRHR